MHITFVITGQRLINLEDLELCISSGCVCYMFLYISMNFLCSTIVEDTCPEKCHFIVSGQIMLFLL